MRALLGLGLLLLPTTVEACAMCISSAFGDRSYTWPYLMLILIPFGAMAVIGSVFMHVTGARLSDLRPWLKGIVSPAAHPEDPQEETT